MTSIPNALRAGLVVTAITAFLAPPLSAQEFTESHLEIAKQAALTAPITKDVETVLPLLAQRVQNRLISLRPDLHEAVTITVQEVALGLAGRRADLDNAIALVWARAFTEEELEAVAEFYASPAGQKFVSVGPSLGQATIQTVDSWSSRVGEEMLDKSREELKKQGYEF